MSWYAMVALGVFIAFVAGQVGYLFGAARMKKLVLEARHETLAQMLQQAIKATAAKNTYHLLDSGHVMQPGDEVIDDDGVNWFPVEGWTIGRTYESSLFKSVRRRGPWVAPVEKEVDPQ